MGAPYPASTYGTPGYGYSPVAQVKSLKGLATAVVILLAVSGVVAIIAAAALFHRASILDDIASGTVSRQDLRDADSSVTASVGLFFFALVAAGVLWIIWQFRFASNAQTFRGSYGLPPAWAIAGWFIPFANYVLPQLQLFQAAKASDPDLPVGQPAAAGRAPTIVAIWWIVYDLAWLLFGIGRTIRPSENDVNSFADVDRFLRADRLSALAALLFVAAAVIAIVMVRALTDRQMRAAASAAPYQQAYPQPAPPWQQYPVAPQPPQTWQPPPPNQTWQPPPPNEPWQPPPAPPPPQ